MTRLHDLFMPTYARYQCIDTNTLAWTMNKTPIRISAHRQLRLPGVRSQAPDAVDASGIATLRVPFRHAATSAPDAQAGPP